MGLIHVYREGQAVPIGDGEEGFTPLPVSVEATKGFPNLTGLPYAADFLWRLALDGRLFVSSDADQNDLVTGQTSYADTTPTFLLDVPAGTTAIPLFLNLGQTGTVAGGAVDVIIEIAQTGRYASGGVSEKAFNVGGYGRTAKCSLYSGATATTALYGIRLFGATIGQDVSPAEGAVPGPFWKPELPYPLRGPATLAIYTYAATTGPTWFWSVGWAEFATRDLQIVDPQPL